MRLKLSVLLISLLTTTAAVADGITREQGDAILSELRQIRQLLEREKKENPAPAAPAPPQKVRLKIGNEFGIGKMDAPIVMVEYTDYQCPFCNRFSSTVFPELKKQFIDTGELRFISRDFPLEFHQHALRAAHAARCAGEQGKYWQMKDALMANSARVSPEVIADLARNEALDMKGFETCLDGGKYISQIKAGVAAATSIGINGTPSFIIGKMNGDYLEGLLVVGAQPLSVFQETIQQVQTGGD